MTKSRLDFYIIIRSLLTDNSQTSVSLLDNLESFLSTFQKDLAAVAGQISELQDRSKDIESRLKSRKVCIDSFYVLG